MGCIAYFQFMTLLNSSRISICLRIVHEDHINIIKEYKSIRMQMHCKSYCADDASPQSLYPEIYQDLYQYLDRADDQSILVQVIA